MSPPNNKIHKVSFRSHLTRRNFGGKTSKKRGEANFLGAFERAYFSKIKKAGIAAGEFSVSGYGIADLAWIAWTPNQSEEFTALALHHELRRRQLHTFEAKLTDWRRALKQAFRYRYFSDKAIVVMPFENAKLAIASLDSFKQLSVGLWSFDQKRGRIQEHYTPTKVSAFNPEAKEKAVSMISSKVNLRKLREKLNSVL
jgi:hypothetical protein